MTGDAEHLFMCLLALCMLSTLGKKMPAKPQAGLPSLALCSCHLSWPLRRSSWNCISTNRLRPLPSNQSCRATCSFASLLHKKTIRMHEAGRSGQSSKVNPTGWYIYFKRVLRLLFPSHHLLYLWEVQGRCGQQPFVLRLHLRRPLPSLQESLVPLNSSPLCLLSFPTLLCTFTSPPFFFFFPICVYL